MNGGVIYVPNCETRGNEKNNRDAVAQPRIGAMRVTFKAILPHEVSLVARQHGDSFVAFAVSSVRLRGFFTIMFIKNMIADLRGG